ncbi:MAG TPA: selenium-binding protein SBP56-related protein [Pyrinomonadaceae bacterium]|nr:selenium-binding protein SBP56-related protein [Pyrinomonadaceae bacterium]
MIRLIFDRTRFLKLMILLFIGGLLGLGAMKVYSGRANASQADGGVRQDENAEKEKAGKADKYLFIWAGDQARTNPDFLAVINFDESSADYGKAVTTLPLPGPGATGNEPHHVGLSRNGRVLACGGLLSVLRAQKEIFFFDVSNPRAPRFISAADPPQSAITDEFYPLENGGFLVTMMGGAEGHAPGRVAEFTRDLQLVAEYPQAPPMDGFNPHGISVRPEMNLMVTSDFICPSTTLHVMPGGLDLRGSVRVWDFRERKILRTITIPNPAGTIDVKLIPEDEKGRAYTAGMTDDQLYLIDTRRGTAASVFDFSTIAPGGWPQLMRMTNDGKRLFISMNTAGKIVMFDTSNPNHPKVLKVLDLGANSGPHYIALTEDEKRLVISDYFLNEDEFGKVHAEGDHIVHVAKVTNRDLVLDTRFQLNFNTAFATGPARPHGVAFK